jgi:hypothetical protein
MHVFSQEQRALILQHIQDEGHSFIVEFFDAFLDLARDHYESVKDDTSRDLLLIDAGIIPGDHSEKVQVLAERVSEFRRKHDVAECLYNVLIDTLPEPWTILRELADLLEAATPKGVPRQKAN